MKITCLRPSMQHWLCAIALSCSAFPAQANPAWYDGIQEKGIKSGMPDFFQHQPLPGTEDRGWCWQTAFLDSIYYWDKSDPQKYGDLYADPSGNQTWLDGMTDNLKQVVNTPGEFMGTYLKEKGHGPEDPNGFIVSTFGVENSANHMFKVFTSEMLASEDVLIYLVDPTEDHGWWWSKTYHVLAGAGIDKKNNTVVFADPDNTKYGRDYKADDPFPVGEDWSSVGNDNYYQQSRIDENGILQSVYPGAKIEYIYAISPVPEPLLLSLLGIGMAALLVTGKPGQRGKIMSDWRL